MELLLDDTRPDGRPRPPFVDATPHISGERFANAVPCPQGHRARSGSVPITLLAS
jgi:hypothetical protein